MNDNEVSKTLTMPTDVDALIDTIETNCVNLYVLGGQAAIGICLAYEMAGKDAYSDEAQAAIKALNQRFNSSEAVRKAILEYAFNIGCAYHEVGNKKPVWNLGHSVQ